MRPATLAAGDDPAIIDALLLGSHRSRVHLQQAQEHHGAAGQLLADLAETGYGTAAGLHRVALIRERLTLALAAVRRLEGD